MLACAWLFQDHHFWFELAPAARPTTASDDRNDPAGWIRVRSDVIENVVEALLEMRQQQGRLRASLPATDRRARHHLQRGDFLLKELYGEVMELHLVPFETVAQRMHQTVVELARPSGLVPSETIRSCGAAAASPSSQATVSS